MAQNTTNTTNTAAAAGPAAPSAGPALSTAPRAVRRLLHHPEPAATRHTIAYALGTSFGVRGAAFTPSDDEEHDRTNAEAREYAVDKLVMEKKQRMKEAEIEAKAREEAHARWMKEREDPIRVHWPDNRHYRWRGDPVRRGGVGYW
ncbi:hypothetical protein BU16DRAFT_532493 [Lophium mytilinum]|uniref:Uncharacterized protein n=1 Tax=Lophium mytilinum TaxID=390894 RepID=A0A6A6RF59_9PEZI|nr:hypothetical protein BU16DRAFT_532493 [Lophium mytilinum]